MTKYKYYKRKTISSSSRLYSKPSFLIGLGSILNIAGNYFDYNYSESEMDADNNAIENDWKLIGQDLKNAFELI